MKVIVLIILSIISTSCSSQENKVMTQPESQIAKYVTNVFEDSKGHLWFGTLEKGIARHDGKELRYFTTKDGLPSDRVPGVIQDSKGIYWFITGAGLSKFNGSVFENISIKDDFNSNFISNILIDSKGIFWIGTWAGVYLFDGKDFNHFSIPFPEVDTPINENTKNWITDIKEDSEGNIWFARDNYGACKYNGTSFTHYLKKDGLHSNNVTEIEFDNDGNIWFGTRVAEKDNPDPQKRMGKGGINKMTPNAMLTFPNVKGFNNNDVYGIYKAINGNIWISTISNGIYRFDGNQFENYNVPISIMAITSDRKGNIWLGGAGGLYRINKDGVVLNIKTNGLWK